MKKSCNNCSNNLDGVCSILCSVLNEEFFQCPYHEPLVGDIGIEDCVGYNMEWCGEEIEIVYE